MPLSKRRSLKWKFWKMPVSYNILAQDRMADARNVCTIQKILQTRPGTERYNDTSISNKEILSLSYFLDHDENQHIIAKAGRDFLSVPTSGASSILYGGFTLDEDILDEDLITDNSTQLSLSTRHRAVTWNGRHFMAVEGDGLYQFDGTTLTQLGQAPPSAPTATKNEGGGSLANSVYQVAITFYDSSHGFETNIGAASSNVTTDGGNDAISVTGIPTAPNNDNIDKIRIYLKDVTAAGLWIFVTEENLGTASYEIVTDPLSTSNPPTKNAAPLTGGAKYLAMFGDKLIYSGNTSFPSDVFFSEAYIPDAFDDVSTTRKVLTASGNGPITGLAVGFYNNDNLSPYICIFKKDSIEVYSELGGSGVQSLVSPNIGAASQDTVKVINGDVYFMSGKGWHIISNGKLIKKDRRAFHLGDGDIDNIFNDKDFTYLINKGQTDSFFSVYYPVLDQYITFVKETGSTQTFKSYNYEFNIDGFRPYSFPLNIITAIEAEDVNGEALVLLATEGGFIMKHSINQERSDALADNTTQAIQAFGNFYWVAGDDLDASYNFGIFNVRALKNDSPLQFNYFLDYLYEDPTVASFTFANDATGFILDVSKLDEGILSDGRNVQRYTGDILKTAESLLITFFHEVENSNINLIEAQVDFSKNGNPN